VAQFGRCIHSCLSGFSYSLVEGGAGALLAEVCLGGESDADGVGYRDEAQGRRRAAERYRLPHSLGAVATAVDRAEDVFERRREGLLASTFLLRGRPTPGAGPAALASNHHRLAHAPNLRAPVATYIRENPSTVRVVTRLSRIAANPQPIGGFLRMA
jgi:hypothetical protein